MASKKTKRRLGFFGTLFVLAAIGGVVYAVGSLYWGYRIYSATDIRERITNLGAIIAGTTDTEINEYLTCKEISNYTCSKNVFVPTKTSAEYQDRYNSSHSCYTVSSCPVAPVCGSSANTCSVGTVSNQSTLYGLCGNNGCLPTQKVTIYSRRCNSDGSYVSCQYTSSCQYDADCDLACFIAGTYIQLADGNSKPIEQIITGDIVLGSNNSPNTVTQLYKIPYQRKLYSINGGKHFVSDSHPFMTEEGRKSFAPELSARENPDLDIGLLTIGDILIKQNSIEVIFSIDSIESSGYVYNFKTDGTHDYYADGYLVHNPAIKEPL